MLKAGYRPEEIERAEAQLQAATSAVAEARARHAAALVREEQAELNLADTRLTAPSDGIVTTRIAEPGSMLRVGAPVLSISLRSPIRVRAYVDEIHLDAVKLGMSVNVRTDGVVHSRQAQPGCPLPESRSQHGFPDLALSKHRGWRQR